MKQCLPIADTGRGTHTALNRHKASAAKDQHRGLPAAVDHLCQGVRHQVETLNTSAFKARLGRCWGGGTSGLLVDAKLQNYVVRRTCSTLSPLQLKVAQSTSFPFMSLSDNSERTHREERTVYYYQWCCRCPSASGGYSGCFSTRSLPRWVYIFFFLLFGDFIQVQTFM